MERKLIAAAVSSALALPMAAQAVEFSISGHVNRAIISVDGGANDGEANHTDSNASESRFRFTGSEELESGMTAGVQYELSTGSSSDGYPAAKDNAVRVRHQNVYLSGAFGKLTAGRQSAAADGMAHARLGGPSWLGGVTNWCSYASNGGPACPSNDGGRPEVLRYDTPSLGPATLSFSTGENDYWDVKLAISGSVGDAGYDIRVGHIAEHDGATVAASNAVVYGSDLAAVLIADTDGPADMAALNADIDAAVMNHETQSKGAVTLTELSSGGDMDDIADNVYHKYTKASTPAAGDVTTASAAVAFGQGTAVAVAWSQDDTADNEYQYLELDHSYGDGSVGVYFKRGETAGTDGSHWGIGVGHNLGAGATAYAGYRQMTMDGAEDVDLLIAGMRVTFN